MIKQIILIFGICAVLSAYVDSDMDGVEDPQDQCPNTLLTDLVDIKGCSIKSLKTPIHYDIIAGIGYSQTNYNNNQDTDTISNTLQLDYYYGNISFQLSGSYYTSNGSTQESGFNDTYAAAYYKLVPVENLSVRIGVGVVLPTYNSDFNNNNTDYVGSINLSYRILNYNLFGGYSHTMVNDSDVATSSGSVSYQDVDAYNFGIGTYIAQRFYTSISYSSSKSIYKSVEDIQSASAYLNYSVDKNWFLTSSYSHGLSESASDHSLSLKVGYFF